ncbi:TetR/AcrR family transcriptional regulator [Goodfellowiella coeruleoviolacea]|uniref:TetR/AcrR family transcriptional regulator n=1 Tax=Goodfellowiella coeruleoviolacea TaxID=334858 RepID=UPI0020A4021D|nr:TetR/AcrR family transcriptional regulator C-terminal domain-containing protein [Goodfellowiella coeruleoviolacea]
MPPPPQRRATGRPPRISRADIVAAAHRIVDAEGVARLTMRRLAAEVGSTPMALYHHVRDRDELLVLLLEDYARRIPRPELPEQPRERIVAAALVLHDVLAERPWLVTALATDDLMGATALWIVEVMVDAAMAAGLSAERAVHAYRAIWYYTVGEITVRSAAGRQRASRDRPSYRDEVFASLDPAELPRLAALADRWTALTTVDTYAAGLRALVDGLLPGS